MGNKSSMMLQDDEIKQIAEETGFSGPQIEKLYTRFAHLDRSNCGSLSKDDLVSIPELAINPLCDRLIQMFFSENEERINFKQFMRVLAAFKSASSSPSILRNDNLSHINHGQTNNETTITDNRLDGERQSSNSLRDKILFIFKIYDADNDGRISFKDLKEILKMMVGNYIEEVRLDKIASRAFAEMDRDKNGYIEFDEFRRVFAGKDLDDKLRVKFFN